jgi:hypothetical protein
LLLLIGKLGGSSVLPLKGQIILLSDHFILFLLFIFILIGLFQRGWIF